MPRCVLVLRGAAVILLSISIAVSGLHPVRAEGTVSVNTPGAGYSVENDTVSGNVSGGKTTGGGNDAAATNHNGESGGGTARTDAEEAQP